MTYGASWGPHSHWSERSLHFAASQVDDVMHSDRVTVTSEIESVCLVWIKKGLIHTCVIMHVQISVKDHGM